MNSFGKFFFDMSKNKNIEIKTGCGRFIKQRQMNASCSEDKHLNTPEHTCTHLHTLRQQQGRFWGGGGYLRRSAVVSLQEQTRTREQP